MIIKHYRAVKHTDHLYIGQRVFLKLTSDRCHQAYRIKGTIVEFIDDFTGSCSGYDPDDYYLFIKWDQGRYSSYRLNDIVIEDTMVIPEDRCTGVLVKAKENIFRDSTDVSVYNEESMPHIIPKDTYLYSSYPKDKFKEAALFCPFKNLWGANILTSNFEISNTHLIFEL